MSNKTARRAVHTLTDSIDYKTTSTLFLPLSALLKESLKHATMTSFISCFTSFKEALIA